MTTRLTFSGEQYWNACKRNAFKGAKMFTYLAGTTTTLKTTWTTVAATTAHPNPITADANGIFPEIYGDGNYFIKIVNNAEDEDIYQADFIAGSFTENSTLSGNFPITSTGQTISEKADSIEKNISATFSSIANMKAGTTTAGDTVDFTLFPAGSRFQWTGYNSELDGGGNFGVLKSGSPAEILGKIFTISPSLYIEAEITGNYLGSYEFGAGTTLVGSATNRAIQTLYKGGGEDTGGVVELTDQAGTLEETITINNTAPFSVDGITLRGFGRQTSYYSADVGVVDGISVGFPVYVNLLDFGVKNCDGSGVLFDSQGGAAGNRNSLERVQTSFNTVDGMGFQRSFLTMLQSCESRQNGVNGFNWNAEVHTSWDIANNYAILNESGAGFRADYMVYTAFTANASDENLYGYQMLGCRGVAFNASGCEFNLRAGWLFQSDSVHQVNHVSMMANVANDNNKADNGWANHTHLSAADAAGNVVVSYQPVSLLSTVAGTKDFISSGRGSKLAIIDPLMQNDGPQAISDGFLQVNYSFPSLTYQKTFAAVQTVEIQNVKNQNGLTADYSGEILVTCQNSAFGTTGVIGTSTYKLLISKSLAGNEVVEIAKVGLVTGAAASHPSFTFTLAADILSATAVSQTAGDFWFAVEKIGGNILFT